jgi:Mg/Co/Ni transporter MgtE
MPSMNRNPVQSTQFKEKQFRAYGEVGNIPLSKKAISIKLPQDVHDVLENLPSEERVAYLRQIINLLCDRHSR